METNTVMRSRMADFLYCGAGGNKGFFLMGMGFTTLDENTNAQAEKRPYISDKVASTIIRGYETQFPFATDIMTKQPVIELLYTISRNQLRGGDAETDYVRVEAFYETGQPNVHPARKFRVAVEVTDITGEGTQHMEMTGNLNPVGDFVPGAFDIATNTFYAGSVDANNMLTVTVKGQTILLRDGLFAGNAAGQGFGSFGMAPDPINDGGKDKGK